jgi:hypothetical protein
MAHTAAATAAAAADGATTGAAAAARRVMWNLPTATPTSHAPDDMYAVFVVPFDSTPNPATPAPYLAADWQEKVARIANTTITNADTLVGLRVANRLVCSGLPLQNLTAVSMLLREALQGYGARFSTELCTRG